jgi:hypothetical protein
MAQITLVDETNQGVPAVIFQDGKGVGAADIDGKVELKNGIYTAKIIGFEDKTFDVKGDSYVLMKPSSLQIRDVEIKAKPTIWKKWVKLGGIGLVIFGIVKYLTKK